MAQWMRRLVAPVLLVLGLGSGAAAGDARSAAAIEDIAETYGSVPGFFRLFPAGDLGEVWYAFRLANLNSYIETDAKTRELIGVAVASQGPCRPCVYFHAASAFANGATKEEIREAIGLAAAMSRFDDHLVERGGDMDAFRRETDLLLWGDARTTARRGPPDDFCAFIIAWAAVDYAGCK